MIPFRTMTQIATEALQRADMVNSTFVDASAGGEVFGMINRSAEKLLEKLTAAEDLFVSTQTLTMVGGTAEYELSSDMNILRSVRLLVNGNYVPLRKYGVDRVLISTSQAWGTAILPGYSLRFLGGSVNAYKIKFDPPPSSAGSVLVEYIPGWTELTSGSSKVSLPFSEYIILDVAIQLREKEQDSEGAALLIGEREILEKRIEQWVRPRDHFANVGIQDAQQLSWGWDE